MEEMHSKAINHYLSGTKQQQSKNKSKLSPVNSVLFREMFMFKYNVLFWPTLRGSAIFSLKGH